MEKKTIMKKLYNRDNNGNLREWYMEIEGDKYRTVSGLIDGKKVTSTWKVAKPKNTDKINATSGEQQAQLEVARQYKKKLDQKYSENPDTAVRSNIFQPMLAESYKDIKDKEKSFSDPHGLYYQPKLDGIRAIVSENGIMSRNGKPIISCPHVLEQLTPLFEKYPNLVLDGELYNHEFKDDFNELTSIIMQKKLTNEDLEKSRQLIQYHVYDLDMEVDYIPHEYHYRHSLLQHMFAFLEGNNVIQLVKTYSGRFDIEFIDKLFSKLLEQGYEGMMIRKGSGLYENKRSKNLIKRKDFLDKEYEIIEIIEGQGNWSGYAKSVLCKTKENKSFSAGIKGTQQFTRELLENYRNGVKPKECTVRYPNLTPDGVPRFGVAVAFYNEERDF